MKIKLFEQFEEDESQYLSKWEDLKSSIEEMIKESIGTEDDGTYREFLSSYLRDPEANQVVGFINDSDIYDFYIKYRSDIDELLSDLKWYDETPSDIGIFSVYQYIIESTKKAFNEIIQILNDN